MRKTNSIQKGQGKRQKGNIFLFSPDLRIRVVRQEIGVQVYGEKEA